MSDLIESVRNLVNNLDALDADGIPAPEIENYPVQNDPPIAFQVQKIITEIYVFTDTNNMKYGSKTFQDVVLMGEMTKDQVDTIISNKNKRKRKG